MPGFSNVFLQVQFDLLFFGFFGLNILNVAATYKKKTFNTHAGSLPLKELTFFLICVSFLMLNFSVFYSLFDSPAKHPKLTEILDLESFYVSELYTFIKNSDDVLERFVQVSKALYTSVRSFGVYCPSPHLQQTYIPHTTTTLDFSTTMSHWSWILDYKKVPTGATSLEYAYLLVHPEYLNRLYSVQYAPKLLELNSAFNRSVYATLFDPREDSYLNTADFIIVYLCFLITIVSFLCMGDRFFEKNIATSTLYLYFPLIVLGLVKATSLLELFVYYELLLLPSVYFVYKTGFTLKSQQANVFFFIWTQTASLLLLFAVSYLQVVYGSTEYSFLRGLRLPIIEKYAISFLVFVGFGVKVPVWPFHYWLTKVHVEAPSGFSIYLSGFLVKVAVYCYYKFFTLLGLEDCAALPFIVCLVGMCDASLKMWGQTDIKKLIAYATIQEMNAIFLFFNTGDSWALRGGFIFLFAHGILSTLMFYLIECLYKRVETRNLYQISGLSLVYPALTLSIFAMIILFLGFPGTAKFFAEFLLISTLIGFNTALALLVSFIFIFFGSVGFVRCWYVVVFGQPKKVNLKTDLSKEEIAVIFLLSFFSIFGTFFFFKLIICT